MKPPNQTYKRPLLICLASVCMGFIIYRQHFTYYSPIQLSHKTLPPAISLARFLLEFMQGLIVLISYFYKIRRNYWKIH
jgi:hypothetical protein